MKNTYPLHRVLCKYYIYLTIRRYDITYNFPTDVSVCTKYNILCKYTLSNLYVCGRRVNECVAVRRLVCEKQITKRFFSEILFEFA